MQRVSEATQKLFLVVSIHSSSPLSLTVADTLPSLKQTNIFYLNGKTTDGQKTKGGIKVDDSPP